jgi:Protein of unknown function (DUF2867)
MRKLVVAPPGLKTGAPLSTLVSATLGIFPVVSGAQDQLVAGFGDSHLDFRVVAAGADLVSSVTMTTLVLTHNLLGRAHLATILPFHRIIIRSMLQQVIKPIA